MFYSVFNENLDKILQTNDYSLLKQPDQIKIYPNEFQPLKWFSFMLIDLSMYFSSKNHVIFGNNRSNSSNKKNNLISSLKLKRVVT